METMKEIEELVHLGSFQEFEKSMPQIQERIRNVQEKDVHRIKDLIAGIKNKKCEIPEAPGLYFVGQWTEPKNLTLCTAESLEYKAIKGGWFGKKWEAVNEKLKRNSRLLYIGKAENLKDRVSCYMEFVDDIVKGKTSKKSHRGGRAICLLKEVPELEIFWFSLSGLDIDPEIVEKQLLLNYKTAHQDYPFANWRL